MKTLVRPALPAPFAIRSESTYKSGKVVQTSGATSYRQSAARLTGTVMLYRRNPATFGEDVRKLNTQRHTIAQALASSDYTLMEKQRIRTFSRDVFDQLRALRWQ